MVGKDLNYYLSLKYPVLLTPLSEEDGGGWLATIPLLPGCQTDGETQEEALARISDAKEVWLKGALSLDMEIAEPVFA